MFVDHFLKQYYHGEYSTSTPSCHSSSHKTQSLLSIVTRAIPKALVLILSRQHTKYSHPFSSLPVKKFPAYLIYSQLSTLKMRAREIKIREGEVDVYL